LDRTHRSAAARLLPSCRSRLFTLKQAALLADLVAQQLGSGDAPLGSPPLPKDPQDRLQWLVEEMDAARGALAGVSEEELDIIDEHGPQDHAKTLIAVRDAAEVFSTAVLAVAQMQQSDKG